MARESLVAQAEDPNRLVALLPTFNNGRPKKSHVRTPRVSLAMIVTLLLAAPFATRVSGFTTAGGMRMYQKVQGGQACCRGRQRGTTLTPRARPRMVATDGSISISTPGSPKSSSAIPSKILPTPAGVPAGGELGEGVAEGALIGPSAGVAVAAVDVVAQRAQRLRVATFFFFWYTFNIGYNLCTKFTLNVLPLPMMLAAIQLLVGVPYVWMLWLTGLRKAPSLSATKLRGATPVAMAHTLAHVGAVVSIGAGAVGFVQVVKGAEPLFTAGLSCLTGSAMPWPVYLTLLPVIGGVGMASVGEISFSFLAFAAAMTSNISAASRSVLGKKYMASESKKDGEVMDAGNLYAVMTMLGCLVLTPLALAMEGPKVASVWNAALSAGYRPVSLIKNGLLSGLFFYLYNEVSFYALNIIHPVTHALGNTVKRVVMIIVSVLVLNHKFTPLGLFGCTTALSGVMAYSVIKAKLENGAKNGARNDAGNGEVAAVSSGAVADDATMKS